MTVSTETEAPQGVAPIDEGDGGMARLARWVQREQGKAATGLWAVATVVLMTLPTSCRPDVVVGSPLGETDNHLWMFWRASQQLFGRAEALGNAPLGIQIPLMDPVNLPAYLAGAWVSPELGWRLMAGWNVLLAMAGGYALARQWVGPAAARVAMVACGSAPFLGGVLDFGISESWTLGWFPLHTALLVSYSRHGGPWRAVGAGICLGAIGLSGWYHASYGLLWEAMLVPVLLIQSRRRGILLQGVLGAVMVLPALHAFLPLRSSWEPRWRMPSPGPPGPRPDWGELPVFGVDLLTFVSPHPAVVSPSKATYLGLVVLVLGGVGVLRNLRRTLPVWMMAVPFLVLALGYWPSVAGKAWGFPGPAKYLVDAIPALTGMSHWFRATGPAAMLVGVAAGLGAAVCTSRYRWLSHMLAGMVLVDALAASPTAWPRNSYELDPPVSIELLAGRGGIIQIPFDNGRTEFSEDPPRLYNRWQVRHQRPVSENYEGVDALLASSELIAPIDAACLVSTTLPPYYQPPPEMRGLGTPSAQRGQELAASLVEAGFDWIVLHRDRCRVAVTPIRALDKVFGAGVVLPNGDRAWALRPGLLSETELRIEALAH